MYIDLYIYIEFPEYLDTGCRKIHPDIDTGSIRSPPHTVLRSNTIRILYSVCVCVNCQLKRKVKFMIWIGTCPGQRGSDQDNRLLKLFACCWIQLLPWSGNPASTPWHVIPLYRTPLPLPSPALPPRTWDPQPHPPSPRHRPRCTGTLPQPSPPDMFKLVH